MTHGFIRRLGLAVSSTALVLSLSASAAMAGEITGRPGTPDVPFSGTGHRTGAFENANSICAFNGLNDMNPEQGPIHEITQNPHNQGSPGDAGHGTCAGGTNFERTK